jgi:predicted DNA-binding transcriptional regulator YafY
MRASRLLSILLLLQTRGRMTAQALADEFEISVRTVYRDIDHLSAAGVPVYADRGRAGGFQLLDGYRTRLTGLTSAEAEALFLSGLPGPAADLGLGDAMAAAQLKLLAALPSERREGAGRVASRFHLDPVAWFRNPERTDILPALAEAVWKELRIRIGYESWTDVVVRELDPLGLALKAGVWYLVAVADGKALTYRVSAIKTFELTGESFTRPAGFDLSVYWSAWAKDFEARLYRGEATLRLSSKGLKRLSALAPAVGEMAARTVGVRDEGGWMLAQIPIESIDHAASEMLKLGAEAEVLAPPELRQAMVEIATRLGAIYPIGAG